MSVNKMLVKDVHSNEIQVILDAFETVLNNSVEDVLALAYAYVPIAQSIAEQHNSLMVGENADAKHITFDLKLSEADINTIISAFDRCLALTKEGALHRAVTLTQLATKLTNGSPAPSVEPSAAAELVG